MNLDTKMHPRDKDAFQTFQELSAETVYLRAHAEVLNATKYKDTSTSAYEEAAKKQGAAHKAYMKSIGLCTIVSTPAKRTTKSKPRIPVPQAPRRKNPRRAARETEEPETEEPEASAVVTPTSRSKKSRKKPDEKWIKCRHPDISVVQLNELTLSLNKAQQSEYYQPRFPKAKYYVFAHRVCRAYVFEWKKQGADSSHINRPNPNPNPNPIPNPNPNTNQ